MLISHEKNFIFLKTEKTAGTSVEAFFEPYCMAEPDYIKYKNSPGLEIDEYVNKQHGVVGARGGEYDTFYNHMPAKLVKSLVSKNIWNNYYKFTIVRNPFPKLVSYFHYIKSIFHKNKFLDTTTRRNIQRVLFHLQVLGHRSTVEKFRSWVRKEYALNTTVPFYPGFVVDRDRYVIDGLICVDEFIHTESLEEGIEKVCDTLSITYENSRIPHLKSSSKPNHLDIRDYYDQKSTDIVRDIYSFEIDYFDYSL